MDMGQFGMKMETCTMESERKGGSTDRESTTTRVRIGEKSACITKTLRSV